MKNLELLNILLDECYNVDEVKNNVVMIYNNIYEFLCNSFIDVVNELENINYEIGCNFNVLDVFNLFDELKNML